MPIDELIAVFGLASPARIFRSDLTPGMYKRRIIILQLRELILFKKYDYVRKCLIRYLLFVLVRLSRCLLVMWEPRDVQGDNVFIEL
jgi:hypothetical protein